MRLSRTLALALAVGLALATVAWAEGPTIQVSHNRLEPADVTISAGDSVTFHNQVEMPGGHTIVADDGSFESPPLAKDESWSHTFASPGQFPYRIKQHPDARGTITVQ